LALGEIGRAASSGALRRLAAEELSKQLEKEGVPLRERRQTITSELAGLSERFNKWADRLDRGLIDESQFAQQNKRLLARKSELSKELEEIDLRLAEQENAHISLQAAQEALKQFPKVWEHLEIQERRELIRQLIERLQVYGDKMVLKLVFSPEAGVAI
jgi:DNA repair exonuclease SbcCD ATPase subunit